MIDIVNSFCKKGYDCSLITGRIVEREHPLDKKVSVKRITSYDKGTNFKRLKSWLIGSIQILILISVKFRHSHMFIVSNPPVATLLPILLRNKFSLMIFDVYPDAIIEFGITKKGSFLDRIWTYANRRVFGKAKYIFTLSEGMKEALAQYVGENKIKVVTLWSSGNFLKPLPKIRNPFILKHDLSGKFVVLYSGNFGIAHQIEVIIHLASKISDPKVMFVIIGGGPAERHIRTKLSQLGITNCIILPWQDVNTLPYSLASADLSIVTLSENATKLGIPSKFFNYLSVGSPILSISATDSELARLVRNYNIGKSFTSQQIDEICAFINELVFDPDLCNLYRRNSLKASELHTDRNVKFITDLYV